MKSKASQVREYWLWRRRHYEETTDGVAGCTFTELNERHALEKAELMEDFMEREAVGRLTDYERAQIERAYKRLPREWRDPT